MSNKSKEWLLMYHSLAKTTSIKQLNIRLNTYIHFLQP